MTVITPIAPKLAKMISMLSADNEGLVIATVRGIDRTLKSVGLDFHDLAKAIASAPAPSEPGRKPYEPADDYYDGMDPSDWRAMARWCRQWDCGRLTPREHRFIWDVCSSRYARREVTRAQHDWVRSIYVKLSRWVD